MAKNSVENSFPNSIDNIAESSKYHSRMETLNEGITIAD